MKRMAFRSVEKTVRLAVMSATLARSRILAGLSAFDECLAYGKRCLSAASKWAALFLAIDVQGIRTAALALTECPKGLALTTIMAALTSAPNPNTTGAVYTVFTNFKANNSAI
ncbi:hypothetical protein AJ87_39730 [Rhizobium yanglingense]|nr:hypothetical protein AJ87_39730 [Rhizobium yanglingense]